jgi:ABC-type branched-subunit amino acid transport system substrate-binding protein
LQVGFVVTKNNSSTASNLGFKGLDNGDEKHVVQALVAAANAAGGLAGHRLLPVFFEVDPATTASYDQIGAEACAALTEDAHPVAVAGAALFNTLSACLAKRGVPGVAGSTQQAYSASELKAMPSIATFGLTARRQATALVDSARLQRYFIGSPRVGVVTTDTPRFHDAVDTTLRPALHSVGAKISTGDIVYGPELKQTSDLSSLATAMQSAVLRFRSDGVTQVLFLQDAAAPALLFMEQADSQNATFRYALTSSDAPQTLVAQGVAARQFAGAVAAGWDGYLDVPTGKAPVPAGRAWCTHALAQQGLAPGSNAEWIAFMHCDALALVLAAARQANGPITAGSLVTGLARVGALGSANIPAARITGEHRWAVAGYRLNHYDAACSCFAYTNKGIQPA